MQLNFSSFRYFLDKKKPQETKFIWEQIDFGQYYALIISNNKYRLLAGPFKNFNTLKTSYISLNNLGFENLNIYKN